MKDYYHILNLPRFANQADIRKSYRRLAVQYHPDRSKDPRAEEMIREINEAYTILSDPAEKSWYDQKLSNPVEFTPQVSRPHRDPAYKRNRTYARPPSHTSSAYELMKQYLPKMIWISRLGLALTILFFVDFIIPYKEIDSTMVKVKGVRLRSSIAYFNTYLESGEKVRIYPNDMALIYGFGEPVRVTMTRIYQTPMSISSLEGTTIRLAYLYRVMPYLPLALFLSSLISLLLVKKRPDVSFNLCVFNCLFLIMNFVFL